MANHDSPLLDLATLVERPKISIDGERYEILSPDELSVLDHQRLSSLGARLESLMGTAKLSTAEEAELGQIIRALSSKVMVGVPATIAARLSDIQRLSVIEVFTGLLPEMPGGPAEAINGAPASPTHGLTGEKSSPNSSVSTAEIPNAGSPASRSRSCGPI